MLLAKFYPLVTAKFEMQQIIIIISAKKQKQKKIVLQNEKESQHRFYVLLTGKHVFRKLLHIACLSGWRILYKKRFTLLNHHAITVT